MTRPRTRTVYRGNAKIRLFINDEHVARVLRVRRALCVGEEIAA